MRDAEHVARNPIVRSQTGGKLNLEFTDIIALTAYTKFNVMCHSQLLAQRLRMPENFSIRPSISSWFA